jgi:general secretion pathway protein I
MIHFWRRGRRRGSLGAAQRRQGFTLIESLAAFAILAMTLGQLLQGVGGAARNEGRADFLMRATREGRAHLEALGVATPLASGVASGTYDDGLVWTLTVAPRDAVRTPLTGGPALGVFSVQLDIRRPFAHLAPGDALSFSTIKLQPEPRSPQ